MSSMACNKPVAVIRLKGQTIGRNRKEEHDISVVLGCTDYENHEGGCVHEAATYTVTPVSSPTETGARARRRWRNDTARPITPPGPDFRMGTNPE